MDMPNIIHEMDYSMSLVMNEIEERGVSRDSMPKKNYFTLDNLLNDNIWFGITRG